MKFFSHYISLPLVCTYFYFNYVNYGTVFGCVSVTINVLLISVNGSDVFPLTDIFVTVN
jgi:hypothetical protein